MIDVIISEILRMYGITKYFLVTESVVSVLCVAIFLFKSAIDFLLKSFFNLSLIFWKIKFNG